MPYLNEREYAIRNRVTKEKFKINRNLSMKLSVHLTKNYKPINESKKYINPLNLT